MEFWTCQPEWAGETCLILAGGASVRDIDLRLLEGRRVITVNSSVFTYPASDFHVFADPHWWWHYWPELKGYKGRIVTNSPSPLGHGSERVLKMQRMKPHPGPGISHDRKVLVCHYTVVQAAMNLAFHLGATRMGLLGVDNGPAPDGRLYNHRLHPGHWNKDPNWPDLQRDDLAKTVKPLRRAGIEVVNCSPGSRLTLWPKQTLEEFLAGSLPGPKPAPLPA